MTLRLAPWLLIVLSASIAFAADAPTSRPAAEPDVAKWATRVRTLLPPGWSVTSHDEDVVIERDAPVTYVRVLPNGPAMQADQKPDLHAATFRIILRFG